MKLEVKNWMLQGMEPRQQSPGTTPQQIPTLIIHTANFIVFITLFLAGSEKKLRKQLEEV